MGMGVEMQFEPGIVVRNILIMATMTLFLQACVEKKMEAPPRPAPTPLPQLTLKSVDGKDISLASFKGHPMIINFWATWCVPCVEELPELDRFYRAKQDTGLKVITINLQEKKEVVKSFLSQNGYAVTALLDSDGKASEDFQVFGLPTTYFINAEQTILDNHMGRLTREILYRGFDTANGDLK